MIDMTEKKEVTFKADGVANPSDAKSEDYKPSEAAKNSVLGARELKSGDKGEDVAALQRKLGLEPTGTFNKETEAKVAYLRRVVGLAEGSVDSEFLRLVK